VRGRRGAWPRPVGGSLTVSRPTAAQSWRAWATRSISSRSRRRWVADVQDLVGSGRGREEREAQGACGPSRERSRWAEPV
jgi:hypothetical protein